jgi:hypothetical protein
MTRRPCDQCYGTDTARECAQGQCYAEQYQREQEEREREEREWRRQYEDDGQ